MSGPWVAVLPAGVLLLLLVAGACLKVSSWHQQESDYWRRVHLLSLLDKHGTDARYLPVLRWCQANRPSIRARLGQWIDPERRMGGAES